MQVLLQGVEPGVTCPPSACRLQLLVVSDLFTERNQFEMMYLTLTELRKAHPSEDEILLQYLVPATCKAAAVLGMVSGGHAEPWPRGESAPLRCGAWGASWASGGAPVALGPAAARCLLQGLGCAPGGLRPGPPP